MKSVRVYWLTCVLMTAMVAVPALATTIVMPADDQLVAKSPLIVEGTVVSSKAVDHDGAIWTESVLDVEKVIKGTAPSEITIREIGGIVGDRITHIYGAPVYTPGERALVFLAPHPAGGYRTVDLYVGKFTEERSLDGRRLWTRDDEQENVTLLDSDFKPLHGLGIQRDAAGFEHFITERTAGRDAAMTYGIENPVIDHAPRSNSGGLVAAPNFTLIDEPTVYRWFAFEQGKTANWYSYGSQNGYSGGGINEVKTAINVWTSASGALIRYAYAGTSSVSPGGLDRPNGVNEILFNDPNNDISGSWSPSKGGVVGQGGFNGTSSGGKWTSPFTADAGHPQTTYASTWNITEGNLTIQDGVSPSAGLSSAILAEIIAHELGHTLGFGHSADDTALMWSSVTGLGASLRADDLKAAQWLYPNGSSTPSQPTVPAAPTNLTATLSGSSVILHWTDNASNETSQQVFLSINNAAYQKTADVAAGATSLTLTGFAPGSYRFYVVAVNSAGSSQGSNFATVTVTNTLTAAIGVSPASASGVAGQTLFTFTDESSGTVTSRSWNFGDGSTASTATVTHTYTAPGNYTITLTVQGSGGASSQATRIVTVTAPAVPLQAAFSYSPAGPVVGQSIAFNDQSTGGVTSWSWTFGDGGVSSGQNPSHAYLNAGSYSVTLTVFRNSESASTTKSVTVVNGVPATPPVSAGFNFQVSGQIVNFADTSTGSPTSWNWTFGDGGVSSLQNPTHTFSAPGSYQVTLIASRPDSSASSTRTVTVTADVTAYRSLISVTAQTDGVGGSQWRTELNLFNAGSESASVQLLFIPGAGAAVQSRSLFLGPKQSATYNNALLDIFGISSGAGALAIEATSPSSSPSLKVSSRTFTGGDRGTYGQGVPDVTATDLPQTTYITGLEWDNAFRTNIGLVNRSNAPVGATLLLMGSDGAQVGVATLTIPANNFQQSSLASLFSQSGNHSDLTLRVTAAVPNALSTYASVVDNVTQDPIYLQGVAPIAGSSAVIPAIGRAPGINGTFWRSDLTMHNPTGTTINLSLRYLPAGTDNRNAQARLLTLDPGRTTTLADALNWIGLASGSGALEISWSGGTGPIISSRTYTSTENGGTYGQSIDPVASFGTDRWVTGLRSDADYRSNVGFVNIAQDPIGVTLTLLGATGQQLATGFVALQPKSQVQASVAALFPGVDPASLGSFTLQAHTDTPNALFAYGSIVDNASGDPVFYAGR